MSERDIRLIVRIFGFKCIFTILKIKDIKDIKKCQKISKRYPKDIEDMSKICLTKLVLYPISFDQHFDQRPWVLEHLNLELVPKSVSGLL